MNDESDKEKEIKSLKREIKKEKEKIKSLKKELDEKKDQLLRTIADFQNYKKRVKKEMNEAIKYSKEELISKFLDVQENLERVNELNSKGLQLIMNQLKRIFEEEGIKEIEAVGKKFDYELHHTLSIVETNEHDDGIIIEEIKKGYLINDRILRPSLVMVAKNKNEKSKTKRGE